MPNPRLIKRTVTEELFEDDPSSCRRPDIDDDNDAIEGDDTEDLVEAPRSARGRTQEGTSVSATEAAGTDARDLNGEEG